MHPLRHGFVGVLVVASIVTAIAAAGPPRPGTEGNGLTETEAATLWSRDADTYISQDAYRQRYGEQRTAFQQIANGTDITFKRPPATAATWTRHDFQDLPVTDANTSIHPPHATLEDGVVIADAHATIFAVQPSTRGHLDADTTPLYIAPNGTLRGFVDYRVRVPTGNDTGRTGSNWSLATHEITEVRLKRDGETVATTTGSHTPAIPYQLAADGSATLTLEADIRVRLATTTRRGRRTQGNVTYRTATRTVSDTLDVEIYDLSTTLYRATYPNGDAGVAIFQSRPWQGFTLTDDGTARVRGVWRFYTARNTSWETLVKSNRTGRTTVASDAIPVYVHAYPSRIGPRAEPVRRGLVLIDTWGSERPSPAGTIGANVTVDVVTRPYTPTYGVAVRAETVDRDAVQVAGIVRGVNVTIAAPAAGFERQLRRSTLTVDVLHQNATQATLRLELRDRKTGTPIALAANPRRRPIGDRARTGYITIGNQRVETNASGVAIVTITQPGIYTARYQPGSWLGHDPAYVPDTATVRWHPLATLDGWVAFLVAVGWRLLPFVVMLYAGHRLLRLFGSDDHFDSTP